MHGAHHLFSFADYLRLEESSGAKHEFIDGRVWAMAGGSPEHAAVAMSVGAWLTGQLRGRPCRVFSSGLRLRVLETGLSTYADITVVCGPLETHPEDTKGHTVINPALVVEVLSPSTESYDRGEKLAHYKRMPSLREIVLVAHDERRVEVWRRTDAAWTLHVYRGEEAARLDTAGSDLPLEEVFRDPLAPADGPDPGV